MNQLQAECREVESDKTIELCGDQITKTSIGRLGRKTGNGGVYVGLE